MNFHEFITDEKKQTNKDNLNIKNKISMSDYLNNIKLAKIKL